MMRVLVLVLVIAALMAATWVAASWRATSGDRSGSTHTGPTIEQIQMLSSLVTTRVDVADVVESRLTGWTGGVRAVLLVKGDYLLAVDLSRAKFEAVDAQARTAVLVLPPPEVRSPRLDHERTKVWGVDQRGLWQIVLGRSAADVAAINLAHRDAQRYVAAATGDPALRARARSQAEAVLRAFFRALGWEITVRWGT